MRTRFTIAFAVLLAFSSAAFADTLELKNGQLVEGKYVGGTEQTVRFQVGNETKVYPRREIIALTVSGGGAPNQSVPNASGTARPAAGTTYGAGASTHHSTTVTMPAGTALEVKMTQGMSSSQPAGTRFTGTIVEDVIAGGAIVAPAGTLVYGQLAQSSQAGRLAGQSGMSLVLTSIVLNGESRLLATDPIVVNGQSEGRSTVRRAGGGALIGGIVDGGSGAGKGAGIGAGVGILRQGQNVTVQPGAVLQFTLAQPMNVQSTW